MGVGNDFQGFALNSNNINTKKKTSQEEELMWRQNEFSLGGPI